jgi:glycosyltransferase involved in cell wall biosynthesis
VASWLALDHPDYEVVAVDDRSTDDTGDILRRAAAEDPRLHAVHLDELPAGWLGKPHALQKAFEASRNEWLVFTDADVRFSPDLLRRALALVERNGQDHLTLFGHLDMVGFWEKVAVSFFGMGLVVYTEAWNAGNPRSRAYCGVGAFQMVRRSAYETIGAHKRLAMEVVDDMKLGKLVKEGGFRSGVAAARHGLSIRWQVGLGNIIRGTTKNLFAGAGFRLWRAVGQVASLLAFNVLPFAALPFVSGWNLTLAAIPATLGILLHALWSRTAGISPLYGVTLPLGALILAYMLTRSTVVTLAQGGIRWRDTFYPLKQVRKGQV